MWSGNSRQLTRISGKMFVLNSNWARRDGHLDVAGACRRHLGVLLGVERVHAVGDGRQRLVLGLVLGLHQVDQQVLDARQVLRR